ncbi:MAG: phytanoyl-CoA dioxygenase family protein [Chromatiales bacterium]|nr:phytanoyl-CoA dioxygenase family protein [Chromatiales bacterium]
MRAIDEMYIHRFQRDGYLVVPGFVSDDVCLQMRATIAQALNPLQGPAEFEVDVGYRGSPSSRAAAGGDTPRRLLNAYSRDQVFRDYAQSNDIAIHLREMMGDKDIALSQCHHNCIMIKMPGHSSETMWHQDIRYWSFDAPELVSVWLALGEERERNGALWVIPGSHLLELDRGRLDRDLFLRRELEDNQALIEQAQLVTLERGDALFFHCRVFHAAGTNRTDTTKYSVAFTYHTTANAPIPGTRSAQYPSVSLL